MTLSGTLVFLNFHYNPTGYKKTIPENPKIIIKVSLDIEEYLTINFYHNHVHILTDVYHWQFSRVLASDRRLSASTLEVYTCN